MIRRVSITLLLSLWLSLLLPLHAHVFQIIVSESGKLKPRVATQWIDFEVVK